MSEDRIVFLRPDAERIASVVRKVEAGARDEAPLRFRRVESLRASSVRMAQFSGAWPIDQPKVVTLLNRPSEVTVLATNILINLPDSVNRKCAIARDGSAWYLVNWQWDTVYAATAATLTTSALEFRTMMVGAVSSNHTSVFTISITTCATATT
jgi:hypothetical protein